MPREPLCGNGGCDDEFIEERTAEFRAEARNGRDLAECVMGFLQAELAEFAEALLAERRQVNRRAHGQQRLVGADIGGGTLAADVLLAGLQRQYVAGLLLAALFDRLPDEPARQQAHIFAARGHEAQRGTAIAHGITETHQLAHGNVRSIPGRRGQDAERGRFGDGGDEDGFAFVRDWFDCLHVFDAAEEVRLLNHDGGGGWCYGFVQRLDGGDAVLSRYFLDAEAARVRVGAQDGAILWINTF